MRACATIAIAGAIGVIAICAAVVFCRHMKETTTRMSITTHTTHKDANQVYGMNMPAEDVVTVWEYQTQGD